ncbi:MAG: hypothetical protein AAGF12_21150 [Myxococcota bacterium]
MGSLKIMRSIATAVMVLSLAAGCIAAEEVLFGPSVAEAQVETNQIDSTAKGTIGFGIVGAELGFFVPALVGLEDLWAYIVFPIVGAAGGAVGGYFLFDEPNRVEGSVAMLAIGLALIVPTLVATLALTAYDPSDDGVEVESEGEPPPEDESGESSDESAEEAEETAEARRRLRDAASGASAGLFRLSERGLHLGVPGIAIADAYTAEEVRRFGANQQTEVHVPVVSGSF